MHKCSGVQQVASDRAWEAGVSTWAGHRSLILCPWVLPGAPTVVIWWMEPGWQPESSSSQPGSGFR